MTPFEWLAVTYFVVVPLAAARYARPRGWLYAIGAILLVIVARFAAPWEARAWLPHAYLVFGYWIPAAFTPGVNERFERWLARADARINSQLPTSNSQRAECRGTGRFGSWALGIGNWPRWRPSRLLELAYLLCYPMVPAAFTIVFLIGDREDITRFWIAVLSAGYACYGSLPWTAARPPRLLESLRHEFPEESALRTLNARVLGRVSHRMNTFPSGHVAVALAAALVVCSVSMAWGVACLAMATAIAVAAVSGRYHYLVDVLIGAGVGAAAAFTAAPGSGPGSLA
jgi:membrane-associated phospholipid phosphatase